MATSALTPDQMQAMQLGYPGQQYQGGLLGTALGTTSTNGWNTYGNTVPHSSTPTPGEIEFDYEDIKILKKIIDGIKGVLPKKEEPDELDQAVEDAVNALRSEGI